MAKQRREEDRFKNRVPVRFRRAGESTATRGFTRDVSRNGMFIQTRNPLPPGSEIEVEVLYKDRLVSVSGVVVHAARVPPHLQAVHSSGMGVKTVSSSSPPPSDRLADAAADDVAPEEAGDKRSARVDPGTQVAVFFGNERRNLELRSLSATGAAVVSPRPLPRIAFVRLHFKLPGRSDLVVDGVPVRSAEVPDGTLLAIRFHEPPPETVEEIEAFVARHPLREKPGR